MPERNSGGPEGGFRPSWYTLAWAVWILFFLIVEAAALRSKRKHDTFSEHWWALFRVREKTPRPVRAALLAVQLGFGVWLIGHLALGLWSL